MHQPDSIQWIYRKGSENQNITIVKCKSENLHSESFLNIIQHLKQLSNVQSPKRIHQEIMGRSAEKNQKNHTFKLFKPLGRSRVEGQELRKSQSLYKSIYINQIDQDSQKEQKFSCLTQEVKDSQKDSYNKIQDLDQIEVEAQNLRNSNRFIEMIKIFKIFDEMRSERIKDIDLDIQFFSDLQVIKDSELALGLQCPQVQDEYPVLRAIRGDGNCLYSSILYPYLEYAIIFEDWTIIDQIKSNKIKIYNILDPHNQNQILIPEELSKPLILQFLNSLKNALEKIKEKISDKKIQFYHLSQLLFVCTNETKGVYDLLIVLMRSIALSSFYQNKSQLPFKNFICEGTEDDIIQTIQTYETEADYLVISLICEILPIKIQILQWEDSNALSNMLSIISEKNLKHNQITLKYAPEHYEILYSKQFFSEWFIYVKIRFISFYKDLDLEYLQFGYCCICQTFGEGQLIRFKQCSHTFCFETNHLQSTNNLVKCKFPGCLIQIREDLISNFISIRDKKILNQNIFFFNKLF